MNMSKADLKDIIVNYDLLLVDLWGVVHDGIHPYPHVNETLKLLKNDNIEVIFVTNAPRKAATIRDNLIQVGVELGPFQIVSSGDMVRKALMLRDEKEGFFGKKIYHLGENRNTDLLADLNIHQVDNIEDAEYLLLSAFKEQEEPDNIYHDILNKACILELPAICANPDKGVIHGDSVRHCSGTFAALYESMGGLVYYYGKPHPSIFEQAFTSSGREIDKSKVLMIGDTLETDILGANRMGIDSALVLTGNMERLLSPTLQDSEARDAAITHICTQTLTYPKWVIPRFNLIE